MAGPRRIFLEPGKPFGQSVVIAELDGGPPRKVRMLCSCGTEYVAQLANVANGNTKSCGCLKTGGLVHHPLRATWYAMLYRCENPAREGYQHYGGRGIKVCPAWHDFEVFAADIARLLGPRPEGMTLDRRDNDGDYDPGNVRWSDWYTQLTNRPMLYKKLADADALACLARWRTGEGISALAREFGVHPSVMSRRLHKLTG